MGFPDLITMLGIFIFSWISIDEWDPETDGWVAGGDQRIPTAMYSFPTITVKIEDFCAQNY